MKIVYYFTEIMALPNNWKVKFLESEISTKNYKIGRIAIVTDDSP